MDQQRDVNDATLITKYCRHSVMNLWQNEKWYKYKIAFNSKVM